MSKKWVFQSPTKWILHEKGRFDVEDSSGNVILRSRDNKRFADAKSGGEAFTIRVRKDQPLAFMEKDGHTMAAIRADPCECGLFCCRPPSYTVYQGVDTDGVELFTVEGEGGGRNRSILNTNDEEVASTDDHHHGYMLDCKPGVDCAWMWGITKAIDGIEELNQASGGASLSG
mmetsp:Transcript_23751/g.55354  ORF Transcript_23751/g.55354 Transcript_23751/m.55354 type:complete len:173 (-) Transcript_23751:35-553(-)